MPRYCTLLVRYNQSTLVVRWRYASGAVEVHSWYGQGKLMVCFWYAHQCGSGTVHGSKSVGGIPLSHVVVFYAYHMYFIRWATVMMQMFCNSQKCAVICEIVPSFSKCAVISKGAFIIPAFLP